MNQSVPCPKCGKRLAYDQASAGELWLCPACGAMMRLPAPPPATAPPAPALTEPTTTQGQFNPLAPWIIVLGALVALQAVIMLLLSLPLHLTWEQVHRQDVFDLKAIAEGLLARGHPLEAYQKFHDLERLVAGNPITDPALKTAVQTAADEENLVFMRIMRESALAAAARANSDRAASATRPSEPVAPPPPVAEISPPTPPPPLVPPAPRRPNVTPLPPIPSALVDDEQIGRTIQNGTQYLLDRFQLYRLSNASEYPDSDADALAVYALLQAYDASGDTRLDPRRNFMKLVLDALKKLDINDRYATYGRSLRASALSLAGRAEDKPALEADLRWLLATGPQGIYTYPMRMIQRTGEMTNWVWDNSNSQYGLLGVWAAAEAGEPVPRAYWIAAQNHWVSCQLPGGQWGYTAMDDSPRNSMTLAGVASLLVTQDYLGRLGRTLRASQSIADPAAVALEKGMDWLESGDNGVAPFNEGMFPGYTAYGLERVGLASGYKYFGAHDWYRQSAADIIAAAGADGGWGDPLQTSFALLFLARGRHPIVMNKLRYAGGWDDHPHDVAGLTRYAAHALERQLNWQVVPLSHDWTDWTDSPILFISAGDPPALSAEDEEKLRNIVLNGGLLLTQAENNPAVTQWATDLGLRLFPQYQWTVPPADHPLWMVHQRLANRPQLRAIGNGARLFMIQLPGDLSGAWQTDGKGTPLISAATHQIQDSDELEFGLNLLLYAVGRTDLRNRLITSTIPDTPDPPAAAITMDQLRAASDSDPEPAAWPRFARWFRRQTNLAVNLTPMPLEKLTFSAAPIAHLTGAGGFTPTDAQCAALRNFVFAGGVVLIDPCGGPNPFLRTVRDELLPRAFPSVELTRLGADDPLLTASGDGMSQLWPLDVRDYVRELSGLAGGPGAPIDRSLWALRQGKGCVIVSSLDITSGLLGTNTWGIAGFTPPYSLALAKNFVLWAWDGAREQ